MKNVIFSSLVLLLLFPFANAKAQVKMGLSAGLNLADQQIKLPSNTVETEGIFVPSVALLTEFPLANQFSLRAAAAFTQKGTNVPESSTGPGGAYRRKINQAEISVSGVYTLPIRSLILFARVGPYLGFAINGTLHNDATGTRDIDFEADDLKKQEIGFVSAIGLGIHRKRVTVFIESGYSAGLSSIADDSQSPVKYTIKNNTISILSAGLLFDLGKK